MADRDRLAMPALGRPDAYEVRSCSISVRDLVVMADIGINREEIGRRQQLRLSVRLLVREVASDAIGATVDYRDVVRHAEALARERVALIETFARRLAAACLGEPGVIEAEVVVDKPAALPNGLASTRIVLSRRGY